LPSLLGDAHAEIEELAADRVTWRQGSDQTIDDVEGTGRLTTAGEVEVLFVHARKALADNTLTNAMSNSPGAIQSLTRYPRRALRSRHRRAICLPATRVPAWRREGSCRSYPPGPVRSACDAGRSGRLPPKGLR